TAFAKSSSTQVLGGSHITSPVNEVFFSPSPSQVLYNLEVMYAMLMPAVDTLSDKALEFQHSFLSSEHVSIVLDILTKTNFLSNADLPTKRSAYLIILKIAKFLLTILGHIKISLLELSRLEEPDEMKAGELETAISLLKQAFHHSLPTCTNEFIVRNIGDPPPSTNVFHATVLSSNRLNTLLSNRPGPLDPITPSIAQDIGNSEGPNTDPTSPAPSIAQDIGNSEGPNTDPTSPNMNSGPNVTSGSTGANKNTGGPNVTSGSTGANKNTGPISPNMNTGPNITTGPASPNMNTSNVKPGSTSPNITTGPNIATSSPSDITTHSLVLSISNTSNVKPGSTSPNVTTAPVSPNITTGPNVATSSPSDITTHSLVLSISPNLDTVLSLIKNTSNVKPGSTSPNVNTAPTSPNITTGPNIATSSPSDITTHSLVLSISPNLDTVLSLIKIIWAASRGDFEMKAAPVEVFTRRTNEMFALDGEENSSAPGGDNAQGDTKDIDLDDILVCKEALELLTVCFLLNNSLLKALLKEPKERLFAHFLCDTLLLCDEKIIRACVQEQLTLSVTLSYAYASNAEQACLVAFLQLLFPLLTSDALETRVYTKSAEYFQLFCRTLNFVSSSVWIGAGSVLSTGIDVEKYLTQELAVLKRLSVGAKKSGQRDILLQGHLSIVKELVCFLNSEKKMEFGVTNGLIRDLINDYLFPTSKLMLKLEKTGEISFNEIAPAVCQSPESISAGFSLLIGLCTGSVPNLKLLVAMLTDMFYPDCAEPLTEWDYLPPIGPKPPKGFVGLKNAGATCYMNSVLQQLFMVDQIRYGILGAEGSIPDDYEDISSDESDNMTEMELGGESRREYNIEILKQIQIIFGYLEFSQLQYYIPKGLWRHFKLQGEPVNVREQQDAVEFFMNLIESLDEALKSLSQDQIMARILGGLYSDQKICQECPHRYSKEEPFSVISVDIRNQCSLLDSLEQYVKGELLEGADAYMCDKCSKKVVTVKRLCVKKLPPILGIQLKRFEYDFERLCAIKFNDYFEFPRHLDMEPYTVKGLAKIEGEMIEDEMESETSAGDSCTKYKLTGIVVHSGQASGGHYYSYILHRGPNNVCKWYKFDDGDVSECKMDDDEEMKAQCFGGDYVGEIYDHISKRVSVRKQKRWWNAYMLFYTRHDVIDRDLVTNMQSMSLSDQSCVKLPLAIERSVWRQNIKFTHDRNQFSIEYFMFIKQLAMCNIGPHQSHNSDKMVMTYIQPLDVNTSDLLFNRNHYIKKLIEDSQVSEDCLKFLQFLSWENPQMSKTVISDLLQQIAFAYCHELRHFFDLLLGLLIMQDSWQTQRILLAMKGIDDERDGLFDTIQKSKSHYQKRAYQCIKCLVALYSKCPLAYELLLKEDDLKKKWMLAAYWLRKELERRPSAQYTQYSYSNWSPPAIQSNETANGYFLERSNSAKKVLEAAFVLCPTEDVTEREATDVSSDEEADEDSTGGEDMGGEDMEGENWNTHSREHRNVRRRKSFQGFGKSKLYLMDRYGYPSTTLPSPSTSSLKPLPSHPTPLLPYDTGSLPYESVPGESTTNPLPYDNNSQGNTLPYDSNSGNTVPYDNNSQGNPLPYDNNSQGNTVPYDNNPPGNPPYDNNSPVNPLPYNDNSPGKTVPYDNNSGNSVPYDNNLQGNPVPYDNTSPGNNIPYHNNSENPLPYDNNSSRGNSSTSIGNPLPYDNNSPGNPVPYDNNPQENPLPYDTPAKPTIPYTSTANILPYETNTLPYDPQGDGTAMDEGNGDDENRLLPSLPPPPPPSSSSSSPSS
ncbi:LOW QUALITY PROTEIN: probable ubiquitin carboxyl-terminal hydrolase FAF-X, partial [Diaphorina citri]|uniref:LOW QUALITY PROTEIN: probable ubiquitin carboxyl-terminal hydrolase FAF-X n=1 Tax=Diaphorina citri TaxID=121845 RepID=A0A3Q0JA72_DIACI